MGYFCKELCSPRTFKIAQSGHTARIFSEFRRIRWLGIFVNLVSVQCDQIAKIAVYNNQNLPNGNTFFSTVGSTFLPNPFKILPKWQNFGKSGHAVCVPIIVLLTDIITRRIQEAERKTNSLMLPPPYIILL